MKRIFLLLAVVAMTALQSCEGDQGPAGQDGVTVESEVFELRNVNFQLNQNNEYTIFRDLNPAILDPDTILIYRMSGTIDPQNPQNPLIPIWQLIPRTLFLNEGELDYDFDFSQVDFTIYAGGTYNLATTPQFINNQTFRIVIVPGYFSRGANVVDFEDYNAVIEAYGIDESNVKVLN